MSKLTAQRTNWREVKLGEIADFQYGYTASAQDVDTGTKLLRITDIVPDLIDWDAVPYCAIDEKKLEQFKIKKGDILIARTGATAGYAKLIRREPEQSVFASYLIRLEMKNKNISPDFIGRIIESDAFKNFVSTHAGGSAQPHANTPVLKNFEISLPDLLTQNQIADVLSTYDDLIENNTRRIKILEEIAQAIYREWFVYFRFPGSAYAKATADRHEKVKMIDSKTEFGKIPEGWEVKPLGETVENYDSKRRPISKMKREEMHGEIPYYGAAKIIDYVNDHIFDGKYLLMAEDGSVITKSGNPVLQFVNEKFWANNHTHILQGVGVSTEYLYLSLVGFPIQGYITGVAQPKINQDNLNRISVLVPENKVAQIFNGLVEPIFADIWKLKESVNTLQKARDLLLPKLVTGEVRVNQK